MDPHVALAPEALKVGIRSKTVLPVHNIASPWQNTTGRTPIMLNSQLVATLLPPGLED
jgi:hypothetical protein